MNVRKLTAARKATVFTTCARHGYLNGGTRNRRAEMFAEGGPAGDAGCTGGLCRMWAGTDLFCASVCHGEYPLDWTAAPVPVPVAV